MKITKKQKVCDMLTDEPISLRELTEKSNIKTPSLSSILSSLSKDGLVMNIKTPNGKGGWIKGAHKQEAHKLPSPPFKGPIRGFQTLREPPLSAQSLQPRIPDDLQPMHTSTAIQTIIQSEQDNIQLRRTLQQILVVYEQLGNLLEVAGLLEE